MVSPQRQGHPQAVQLGPRDPARAGPHLQPGADELPGAALAHRGAGRQQRGLPPAAAWNELLAERVRQGRPARPGHHRPRLHPAAVAGGLDAGLLPEPALRRVPDEEATASGASPTCSPPTATGRTRPRPSAGLRRGRAGVRSAATRRMSARWPARRTGKPPEKPLTLAQLQAAVEKNAGRRRPVGPAGGAILEAPPGTRTPASWSTRC